jgi:xanthine/CO dehydrogenase XdhC/CoxF family maturation factor
MNELQRIVDAYAGGRARGERMALATVVSVEGSAYRRPGARMVIEENGNTTGTISGGCLERDVAERAAQVLKTHGARTLEYDTRGDEDIVWGLGLGCNGVVRVLLESLHEGGAGARALEFIAGCLRARKYGVLATVVAQDVKPPRSVEQAVKAGERLLLDEQLNVCGAPLADVELDARIGADALEMLACKRAALRAYETSAGRTEIFYDVITPPRPLVVFGAEQDALPLVRQAQGLGWHVTVVDTRARPATGERFAQADEVLLCRAADVAARVSLTENTAAVVMTHNYPDDVELLRTLLPSPACYLGILGPRARTSKLLVEIGVNAFGLADARCARLHSPIGMDIGAETPEEIALSIVSEIKAVCAARGGGFLRDRNAPIHEERAAEPVRMKAANGSHVRLSESAPLIVCHST